MTVASRCSKLRLLLAWRRRSPRQARTARYARSRRPPAVGRLGTQVFVWFVSQKGVCRVSFVTDTTDTIQGHYRTENCTSGRRRRRRRSVRFFVLSGPAVRCARSEVQGARYPEYRRAPRAMRRLRACLSGALGLPAPPGRARVGGVPTVIRIPSHQPIAEHRQTALQGHSRQAQR